MSENGQGAPHELALDLLCPNEDYQPRSSGLDERHVRLLTNSDPEDWAPVLVRPNDAGGFDILDGFHRFEAARRLGLGVLRCRVDPSGGYPEAVAANLRHGLPLSLSDRRDYARWLFEQDASLSLREIGRQCGLNHETVKRALEDDGEDSGDSRQLAAVDPVRTLVRQVYRTYQSGAGRSWLGLGRVGNPRPFRQAIEAARDDERDTVARALYAFGQACVAAAAPYVADE